MARSSTHARRSRVLPYDQRAKICSARFGAGGIALENALLYDEIPAFLMALCARACRHRANGPDNKRHSLRVSVLSVALAEAVDRTKSGPIRAAVHQARPQRDEYASLLHDFGKIGVREEVLIKRRSSTRITRQCASALCV